MGWVSGSAWTDALVFWSPLGDQPTWDVIFKDFGVACGLTALMLCWLVLVGAAGTRIESAQREAVERYFITNAGSFLVGWGWVVLLRDLSAATARMIDTALGGEPKATQLAFLSEAATVVLFGPILSILLLTNPWRNACAAGRCCCQAPDTELTPALPEPSSAQTAQPPSARPPVAFEGGGSAHVALGRRLRQQRVRVRDTMRDQEQACASGAPAGAPSSDVEAGSVAHAVAAAETEAAAAGRRSAPRELRQSLLRESHPGIEQLNNLPSSGASAGAEADDSIPLTRASLRESLLASVMLSDPVLSAASRVPSQTPTPRASLSEGHTSCRPV